MPEVTGGWLKLARAPGIYAAGRLQITIISQDGGWRLLQRR